MAQSQGPFLQWFFTQCIDGQFLAVFDRSPRFLDVKCPMGLIRKFNPNLYYCTLPICSDFAVAVLSKNVKGPKV